MKPVYKSKNKKVKKVVNKRFLPKPTKTDMAFAKQCQELIKGLNRRMGKKMCSELDADCFDCRTRWVIAELNHWINILT